MEISALSWCIIPFFSHFLSNVSCFDCFNKQTIPLWLSSCWWHGLLLSCVVLIHSSGTVTVRPHWVVVGVGFFFYQDERVKILLVTGELGRACCLLELSARHCLALGEGASEIWHDPLRGTWKLYRVYCGAGLLWLVVLPDELGCSRAVSGRGRTWLT